MKNSLIIVLFILSSMLVHASNAPSQNESIYAIANRATLSAYFFVELAHANPAAASSLIASQLNSFELAFLQEGIGSNSNPLIKRVLANAYLLALAREEFYFPTPLIHFMPPHTEEEYFKNGFNPPLAKK